MRIADLKGTRLALFGLGREGRAMYQVLRQRLPSQNVTILNDQPLPTDEYTRLAPGVEIVTGEAVRQNLARFEVIIKSPGVSPYHPAFESARSAGVKVISPTRLWFAEHPHVRTACITGTKGKSTSAALLAYLARHAGVDTVLAGNIGVPLWEIAEDSPQANTLYVIELSSYQTCDLDAQPSLSVLLNLFPEHTDWHGSHAVYYRDKLNLLTQTANHPKIINRADPRSLAHLPDLSGYHCFNDAQGFHVRDDEVWEGAQRKLKAGALPLPGRHNLSNLCAVLTALRELDIHPSLECLATFQGLPHRLERLGEHHGVRYVDDSISTTPQSVIAALDAFTDDTVVLLVGGYERNLDWHEAALKLRENPLHSIIALGANGKRIIATLQQHAVSSPLYYMPNLPQAVALATRLAPRGGVVLLSPGAPSYDEFTDFAARGNAFLSEIKKLTN